jgi:hypothetical protein
VDNPSGTDARLIIAPEQAEQLPLIELVEKATVTELSAKAAIAKFDAIEDEAFVGILEAEEQN